jgi:hypothetical protein
MREAAQSMDSSSDAIGGACSGGSPQVCSGSLQSSLEAQREALEQLGQTRDRFRDGIDRAGREIEKLFELYRDVAVFKYLLARQKALVRQSRYLADKKFIGFEDRVRLKELSEEQDAVGKELTALKEAFREHAVSVEEEYPRVAQDARAIAAQIEELAIEATMAEAAGAFSDLRRRQAHEAAERAYEAMLSMVRFCNGAGQGAEGECEARLKIVMNMGLGDTFGQLARGLGSGKGGLGGVGIGADGSGGSVQSPFGLYGASDLMNSMVEESDGMGRGRAFATRPPGGVSRLAADTEDLVTTESSDLELDFPGGARIIEEYRRAIVEYFTRLAEQEE